MADGAFGDMTHLHSWEQYDLMLEGFKVALEREDPEDTLMVQLTLHELSMVSIGLLVAARIFPELGPFSVGLQVKLAQLSDAQEYLSDGRSTTSDE